MSEELGMFTQHTAQPWIFPGVSVDFPASVIFLLCQFLGFLNRKETFRLSMAALCQGKRQSRVRCKDRLCIFAVLTSSLSDLNEDSVIPQKPPTALLLTRATDVFKRPFTFDAVRQGL